MSPVVWATIFDASNVSKNRLSFTTPLYYFELQCENIHVETHAAKILFAALATNEGTIRLTEI